MQLIITSASGNILTAKSFARVSLMTENGEITILPEHESLLSAIRPGILHVEYYNGHKLHINDFVTGGGVLNISQEYCTIVADVIESEESLSDLEYIESQKQEAEKMVKQYHAEHEEAPIDAKRLMELEYELLKFSAMYNLSQKSYAENIKGERR